jgi:TetR/AcrR family transcriptional regulator, cholesterol catabolism regulator
MLKERIKQKADELFMQYGLRSVTMDEIAVQLGVSKKTLYQNYADKDALVEAVVGDILSTNEQQCNCDCTRAKNAIDEVFLAMDMMQEMFQDMNPSILFEMEKYHPKAFEKFLQHKYNFIYKILKENIDRGINEELYRTDIDVEILVKARLETMMLPFNQIIFPKSKFNLMRVETALTTHFLFGLATVKGYKLITKYQQERHNNKKTNTNEKTMV